jgi:hypothetical protein
MGNTFTNMGQIKPGENTGFDLVVTDPPQNISSYTISGSYERTHISKPEFLSLTVGSYYLDAGGHYHLTGKITNEGSAPTKFVKAAGVFFDVNKKIVDVGSEYTMPTDLQPIYSTIFL